MHVIIAGAGAAGLGAAWRLRKAGVNVTVIEQSDHAGGRCRSVYWHGDWRITGAAAFIAAETNLVEQARSLDIYNDEHLVDLTGLHAHDVLVEGRKVVSVPNFEPITLLRSNALPLTEKLSLAKVLPKLVTQMLRSDGDDPTSAVRFDRQPAGSYLRAHAPTFVDYLLEPVMQHFNGFSEDDFSLGWLLWILSQGWTDRWWSLRDGGVGRLTRELATHLEDQGVRFQFNTSVCAISGSFGSMKVEATTDDGSTAYEADAVISAVPGCHVNGLVSDLDADHRKFFSAVEYGALHLAYFLVTLPEVELPAALLLPTVDGFETTAYYYVDPIGDGKAIVHAEMKGAASAEARDQIDGEVREALWRDIVAATPAMDGCHIEDFLLLRNDAAIVKPYPGYLNALNAFRALEAPSGLAFCGDYLITSTVGRAHYTGLQAADHVLARHPAR